MTFGDLTPAEIAEGVRALQAQHPEAFAALFGAQPDPEVLQFRVNVGLELRGPNGELKVRRRLHNLVVTAGKQLLLASGGTALYPKQFSYLAIGTGAIAAAIADTALGAEVARAAAIVSNPDANTLRFTYTFPAGTGTGALTEVGLLDANAVGHLLVRQVFAVVNKGALDSFQATIDLT